MEVKLRTFDFVQITPHRLPPYPRVWHPQCTQSRIRAQQSSESLDTIMCWECCVQHEASNRNPWWRWHLHLHTLQGENTDERSADLTVLLEIVRDCAWWLALGSCPILMSSWCCRYDEHTHERFAPGDPSKRAFTYFVLTGGRFIYASALRLAVLKFILSMSVGGCSNII